MWKAPHIIHDLVSCRGVTRITSHEDLPTTLWGYWQPMFLPQLSHKLLLLLPFLAVFSTCAPVRLWDKLLNCNDRDRVSRCNRLKRIISVLSPSSWCDGDRFVARVLTLFTMT